MTIARRLLPVLFALGLRVAASAQLIRSTSPCDASLWNHVHPAQLVRLHECMRVTGTIVLKRPGSFDEVLDALEHDHDFLLKGDVFTRDVLETWIDYKRKHEVDAIRLRPHPCEFALYFDI